MLWLLQRFRVEVHILKRVQTYVVGLSNKLIRTLVLPQFDGRV